MEIVKIGTPSLQEVAQPVVASEFNTHWLKETVQLMWAAMEEHAGVGLAAPQIEIDKRIFVYGFSGNTRYPDKLPVPKRLMINPTITWVSNNSQSMDEEGCLSVPGTRGQVQRFDELIVTAYDEAGREFEHKANGFEARIIQHEIDHLNGILFLDRIEQQNSAVL